MATQDVYVTQLPSDSELGYRDQADADEHLIVLGQAADATSTGLRNHLHLADVLNDSGITVGVKNTFLDFEPSRERTGLRAVQTASGALNLMG
jgi:hypothetical protein